MLDLLESDEAVLERIAARGDELASGFNAIVRERSLACTVTSLAGMVDVKFLDRPRAITTKHRARIALHSRATTTDACAGYPARAVSQRTDVSFERARPAETERTLTAFAAALDQLTEPRA